MTAGWSRVIGDWTVALRSRRAWTTYLELLALKPGALGRSLALRQERERGAWADCYDELWQQLEQKVGAANAARQMVDPSC